MFLFKLGGIKTKLGHLYWLQAMLKNSKLGMRVSSNPILKTLADFLRNKELL